jgi:predicted nucleic acid-binding protein
MPVVVDTSVILAVVLNEPSKPTLIRLTAGTDLIAPLSLHWEVGNALSAMFKRKRLTLDEGRQALVAYQQIAIRFFEVSLDEALVIAAYLNIYAYDAYFVACARSQHCGLITLDNGLRTAAQGAGITVVEVNP